MYVLITYQQFVSLQKRNTELLFKPSLYDCFHTEQILRTKITRWDKNSQ